MLKGYPLFIGDLTVAARNRYIWPTMHTEKEKTIAFQLKGGLYPLTALQLLHNNLDSFEEQLIAKIRQAPKFFYHAPVVLDLQMLAPTESGFDFDQLLRILQKNHLIPVGIKGGSQVQQVAAGLAGLAILQDSAQRPLEQKPPSDLDSKTIADIAQKKRTQPINANNPDNTTHSRVIDQPVRSGQQIYVRGGDLIVLAAVSHGAELLADGNIHVYGPLRGRALAGVSGDTNAHIFCQSLEAELVSIAGQYKISEDIAQTAWRLPVDISLVSGHLQISAL